MKILSTFAVAFLFSFIGTIPPGTLTLTIVHLGLNDRIRLAFTIAVAAALAEYPYAWLAVEFQGFIQSAVDGVANLKLVGGVLMMVIGVLNLLSTLSPAPGRTGSLREGAFRVGILLGILNPVAIPFWIATTAYIRGLGWISLSDSLELHAYLLGISMGTLSVFILLACLAKRLVSKFRTSILLPRLPGALLIILGAYAFGEYMFG